MKKCLVVDDVEVTRFTSDQILSALGFECIGVASVEEALAAFTKSAFDVIFLDWHLRKVSGLDLIARIKTTAFGRPKIIVFSGVEGKEKKAEALDAGADAFVEKPTTKDKLQASLKDLGVL